jgi:hypothetical protein
MQYANNHWGIAGVLNLTGVDVSKIAFSVGGLSRQDESGDSSTQKQN